MEFFDLLTVTVGIDPGSENLKIIRDGEVVFNEPTKVSIDRAVNKVSGIGNSIDPSHMIVSPVNCVLVDFQAFELLLRGALKKTERKRWFPPSYRMFFNVPTSITEIEKRAYRDSGEHSGAKEVYMLYQCCAAAIGMNILHEKKHFIIIDFSASKVEITVMANELIISNGCIRLGLWKIFKLLKNYFLRTHMLTVSDNEIENLLNALKNENLNDLNIQHSIIKRSEIQNVLSNYFNLINDEILETIERAGSHADIGKAIANGVYLTGGAVAFEYLRNQISLGNRLNSTVSKTPHLDTTKGLQIVMANKEKYKNYLLT